MAGTQNILYRNPTNAISCPAIGCSANVSETLQFTTAHLLMTLTFCVDTSVVGRQWRVVHWTDWRQLRWMPCNDFNS